MGRRLELEIEPFALKVVHPLARGAQPAAGTPHRIGDQDRHFGITAVDIVPVGQQPPGRIGFSGLDNVLLLPGADIPVGLDQLRRIEDIAADRLVVVRFAGDVQQREVIGRGEERHPLLRAFDSRYMVSAESELPRNRFNSEGLFTAIARWNRKSPHQTPT